MSEGGRWRNWFSALVEHWHILRTAWHDQDVADRTKRTWTDHEFLPAALEITEAPPSPGMRWLLLSLCAVFGLAICWSFIGRLDVVATATGKIVPVGSVKVIQPIELGYVRAIHVWNGQHVTPGELLVELDPTLTGADADVASSELLASEIQGARNEALLNYADGGGARFRPPAGAPKEVQRTQARLVASSITELEAQEAALRKRRAQHMADLAAADAQITKLERTLPLVDRQIAAREELTNKGYFSKLKLLEYQQMRVEHVQDLAVQRATAARAQAAIGEIDAQLIQLRSTFTRTAATELSQGQDRARVSREEVTKAARRRQFQQLTSPVAGTVQQLSISTVGGVVQPAQPLMIIVPDAARPVVEANVLNRDIGSVRVGQRVRVKIEAYPFTQYGVVQGVVESISRDAIDLGQAASPQSGASPGLPPLAHQLVYAARIKLLSQSIRVGDVYRPLGPGLAVQAEIVTQRRRIIDYLLSPLMKAADEAARER